MRTVLSVSTRQEKLTSTMAQLVHFLLLAAVGICCAAALMEMPIPEEGGRSRRGAEENFPEIYPRFIYLSGGVYKQYTNGYYYTTGQVYNGRPVYKGGKNRAWSVYYRVSGYAPKKWVLDFNAVDETWAGTVAIHSTLFSHEV